MSWALAAIGGASGPPEKVGLVALLGCCAALLACLERRRLRAGLGSAVLVLAPVLLVVDVWHSAALSSIRNHPLRGALLGAVIVVAAGGLALLLHRRPRLLPPLALLLLPLRVPISAGGTVANLLVPLYVAIAGATVGLLIFPPADLPRQGGKGRMLRLALGGYLLLYGLQALYSPDFAKALQNATFFYAPFTLLMAALALLPWDRRTVERSLQVVVGLAAVLVAVGFAEYARGKLFLNPRLIADNTYSSFFRVNSLFFDPNIFGRFLALVLVAAVVALYATRTRNRVLLLAAAVLWLWGGLLTTYSESSMIALLVGLAVVVAYRYDPWSAVAGLGLVAVVGLLVLLLAPASARFGLFEREGSANAATSGRVGLVSGGLKLFAKRPLYGFGSGSFAKEFQRQEQQASGATASHTTPVTVAAEQGLVGLASYLFLLATALLLLWREAGRSPPQLALFACFVALVVHTLGYADFLEDPTTWFLLGAALALAARGVGKARPAVGGRAAQPLAS
jgi:putative inorganic carbon (HCO3(-)) transporter